MFWTIIGILLLIWIVGFLLDFAGGLIHILLVVALIVFIYKMIRR
ncbi:lmo0937 family membrane protein [Gracilibacillus oryzae]|uniref:Lmo0937 family membrane protein n=1 Tax=Gracilibacillus oryzae TaxID=1672701 RepID=A0A7C8GRC2_9BACI|nr:lmo0937 family membrane protein [Gracilibacillus oryzae]KAB8128279.1 lmo0937 family membrane protein [Gracilibacillus oryzae]